MLKRDNKRLDILSTRRKNCPYFPSIQSECGKIRTRITPNTDTFHVVIVSR